jgi:hypothetical protein
MERRRPGSRGFGSRPRTAGRGACPRHGFHLAQQIGPGQAGIPQPALRVEDPQFRRPPRRPEAIPRDTHLYPLAHHFSSEPDPRPAAQLQSQRRDLRQGAGQLVRQAGGLEHEQLDAGLSDQRRQPVQPLPQCRRRRAGPARREASRRQVQQQHVHRPVLEEQRRHRQRLLDRIRGQDDQPVQPHSPGRGLDWIQAAAQIQISRYAARGLGPGDGQQSQRGLAAAGAAVDGRGRRPRQSAQPQDRIQSPKTGRHGALVRRRGLDCPTFLRRRRHGQRPHHLRSPARSGVAPAFPQGRKSGLDAGGGTGHGIHNNRTSVLRVNGPLESAKTWSPPSAAPPARDPAICKPG